MAHHHHHHVGTNDANIADVVTKVLGEYGAPGAVSVAALTAKSPDGKSNSSADADVVARMVAKAIRDHAGTAQPSGNAATSSAAVSDGVFETMDAAVEAAALAQQQYLLCSMSDRARFVQGIRDVILNQDTLEKMSRMAVEETGMGNYEHKLIKNRLAGEKTPGIEDLTTDAFSGDNGLTLVEYSPFGVIGAITPTTNPTETIVCNSIGMLAAGNSVVFSPHGRARQVSLLLVRLINQKLAALGAPENLVVTVEKPSRENTLAMMAHPKVRMLVATGGPALVKAVLSTGKKAIGAGAGNPPVVVDETANIEKAACDIVNGCSFDNNITCTAEKEIIAVAQIADYLIFNLKKNGAYEIKDPAVLQQLQDLVLTAKGGPQTKCVGKSAVWLLSQIGISVDASIKIILMEVPREHPFVQEELMMPILPLVRVETVDDAIDLAIEVEHDNRHTAIMHSTDVRKLTKMAKLIQTTIFVKNGPSYAGHGAGGEGYSTFTIAGPTGEGLTSAKSFARRRKCVMVEALNIR
uniref:Aldehyde dehydrogenase n=1 Tax=Rhodopseudomonas palustris (strain BisB18) TaxID=316056 RepID=UPI000F51798F|nr:Chain A, Aldehyde dehydrogenase [Rhodopseudomonas palustris BisB18]6GVS_B Chain B, Aldehyde dehydrogenase [Rhodopseudomonas palustris BisB18]6GVS_C Chain C, Aldehyde dehydrogenase [Rhodopseudomonas palustris BisB18]6GVS_D Chain D, Aldehyde dehydrogenase [Rhodopseudomonas palustris BisB18]6GVS_E Chain E, Aldehyde dehydrogenase [Rhodopseudomonas palustris BisB18]6GVS_F Chain F, Aldehyde dehydrogenase [Rhodopseudomonas palustris BisB18]6GVS_G Chain G, Aldehyde dehydrogenase [Rhodopseudomonas 